MKKGQISMFVIIGAVILLAAGLYFFINEELSKDKPVLDVPDVSLETRPASQLIESCLESTAEQAIRKIASQGGYIDAPEGSSVLISPNYVPLWRYMTTKNCNAQFGCSKIEKPPLCKLTSSARCQGQSYGQGSIEEAIEINILNNIDKCIDGLASISDFYDVEMSDEKSVEIFFKEGSTSFILTNPIIASSRSTNNIKELEYFRAELDIDLLKLYRIASDTLKFIDETNIYETQTMNLISIYSCPESECLPPTGGFSLSIMANQIWIQENVKQILETEILPLISLINIPNFDDSISVKRGENMNFGNEGSYNPYIDGLYSSFTKPMNTGEHFSGYTFNQYYTYDPLLFKFQIDDGKQLIKPKPISLDSLGIFKDIFPIGFANLQFNYFISYPLVLVIKDTNAFHGQGLNFNFGIEVDVIANKAGYDSVSVLEVGDPLNSINLNSPENRVNRNVTIKSYDKLTGESLADVIINYYCLGEYPIGLTKLMPDGDAILKTTLPNCEFGGFISYSTLNYFGGAIPFNNPEGSEDKEVSIELWPVKEKTIIVKKRSPQDLYDIFSGGTNGLAISSTAFTDIENGEQVTILLNKHKESPYEDNFPIPDFGLVQGKLNYEDLLGGFNIEEQIQILELESSTNDILENVDFNELREMAKLSEEQTLPVENIIPNEPLIMDFIPGTYSLEMNLFDYGTTNDLGETVSAIFLPEYTQKGPCLLGSDDICLNRGDDILFDELEIAFWGKGGGFIDIEITPEFLYESDEPITLYVLEIPKPTRWNCDYLENNFCSTTIGYCGDFTPEDETTYCVPFDIVKTIEEYQIGKEPFITDGLV